ncbi:hypothetical protein [Haliangium sp.]
MPVRARRSRPGPSAALVVVAGLLLGLADLVRTSEEHPARAQARPALEPIRDRDYAIDLYQGTALGSVRIVAMGGAAVALAEGSASMLVNPAAPAVRLATSNDPWDWDWHFDWLSPGLGSDHDNNGIVTDNGFTNAPLFTLGLVGQYRQWGLGFTVVTAQRTVTVAGPDGDDRLTPSVEVVRVSLARSFARERVVVGVGVRSGGLGLALEPAGDGTEQELFDLSGAALEAGVVWRPAAHDVRLGFTGSLPVTGRDVNTQACDPEDCAGYILPRTVVVPWELALGAAWRWAPTRWNRRIPAPFRDERAVLLALDVVLTGPVERGHGFEAFLDKLLQPSGRAISVSVRGGVEYEWLPGRLRLRGGSYWEPGRVDGVGGRTHLTAGLEWRFWQFELWGERRRLRLSATFDGARRYGNAGLSLGFWH